MYATNQFRKGLKVEIEGTPFEMIEFQHVTPGKGSGFTRTKLKNLLTGNVVEQTYKSGEKLKPADILQTEMQYLYADQEGYHFMDMENYEQYTVTKEQLGERTVFLQENAMVEIMLYNGSPIGVELPNFVELNIKDTEPNVKGDTVTGGKPATLETGATVTVPFHLNEGDTVKVDTRDGSYVEKVNK